MTASWSRPATVEAITRGLQQVLRGGARLAWLIHCDALLELVNEEREENGDDRYRRSLVLERWLLDGLSGLGEGRYGVASRLLFGSDPYSRGLLLKDRRRLAAEELNVLPSTFRRTYEHSIVSDLAAELWRSAPGGER